jgi:hypothetical protein
VIYTRRRDRRTALTSEQQTCASRLSMMPASVAINARLFVSRAQKLGVRYPDAHLRSAIPVCAGALTIQHP